MDRDSLGAWDLVGDDGKPRDWNLEIEKVIGGVVKSKERPKGERKPLVYFRGTKKPLVLNATNGDTITSIAGSDDVDRWPGICITLYPTRVKGAKGGHVPAIRVRPMKAKSPPEAMGEGQPVDERMRSEQEAEAREPGEEG